MELVYLGLGRGCLLSLALAFPEKVEELVNLIVGILLVLSPFVLGFVGQSLPMGNHLGVGLLLIVDSLWAMYQAPKGVTRRMRRPSE